VGMQPLGVRNVGARRQQHFTLPKKAISQILTGEFRLTKKLIKEQTEAYLASEGAAKAARKLLELVDSEDEDIALKAAKDILDRVGVKEQKESIADLVKMKTNGEVPEDWLERIVDEEAPEIEEDSAAESDKT
jgi:hypothetical protein